MAETWEQKALRLAKESKAKPNARNLATHSTNPQGDPNSLGGLNPPDLPPEARNPRDALLDRLIGPYLNDLLFSSSAMRSHGSTLGQVAGNAAIPFLGGPIGSVLGNLAVTAHQYAAPQAFGEPPIDALETALWDTGAGYVGSGIAKGLLKGGKLGIGATRALLSPNYRGRLAARVFNMMGVEPAERAVRHPLSATGYQSTEDQYVRELMKEGMPMSVAQIQSSPAGLAIQGQNRTGRHFIRQQQDWVYDRLQKELEPMLGKMKGGRIRIGNNMTEVADWLNKNAKWKLSPMDPEGDLRKQLTSLPVFEKFQKTVGTDRARMVLMKDWFDSALEGDLKTFNPAKMSAYMRDHAAVFKRIAESVENSSAGNIKASALRAQWNRLMAATSLAARGNEMGTRAMEMEATNAGVAFLAAVPTIGILNYPTARAAGVFSKLTLLGPRLTAAMSDPDIVNELVKLQSAKKGTLAHKSSFKSFVKMMERKGIPLAARDQAGRYVYVRFNPELGKFDVVNPDSMQTIEEETGEAWNEENSSGGNSAGPWN